MFKLLKSLFFLIFVLVIASCASDEKNADTADGAFAIAKEYDDAERYEIALQKYADVKNKFPYSALATQSELAMADVHYKRESFPEAQISYQNFRELHPKHPKIDYVIFKTGMSYYMQLPETIDRDLTLANDAIYSFQELIKKFPNSEFTQEAREKRDKAFVMLAEKEIYIADFYFKKKFFDSALLRYIQTLEKYSGYGLDPKALFGAARSALQLKDQEKYNQYKDILLKKFAQSDEAKKIKDNRLEEEN